MFSGWLDTEVHQRWGTSEYAKTALIASKYENIMRLAYERYGLLSFKQHNRIVVLAESIELDESHNPYGEYPRQAQERSHAQLR